MAVSMPLADSRFWQSLSLVSSNESVVQPFILKGLREVALALKELNRISARGVDATVLIDLVELSRATLLHDHTIGTSIVL